MYQELYGPHTGHLEHAESRDVNPYLDKFLQLERGENGSEVVLNPSGPMCSGRDGYVHFSIVATVAEEAAWQAIGDEHAVPSSISISLLRPAHITGGEIVGSGEVLKNGRQVISSCGYAYQGGKLLAHVTVSFVHFEKDPQKINGI